MAKTFELYLPRNTDAETRKAFVALISKVKAIEASAVTQADLDEAVSNIDTGTTETGDTNPPTNPSSLAITKFENRNRLTWVNSTSSDVAGIYVWRSEGGGANQIIAVVTHPVRFFDDTDVSPFNDYVYYIQAVDDAGNVSEMVIGTMMADTLPAPDEIRGSSPWDQDDINISWDAVDGFGVAGYRVELVGLRTVDVIEPNYSYNFVRNIEDGGPTTSLTARVYTIGSNGELSPAYAYAIFTHSLPGPITDFAVGMTLNDIGFILTWTLSDDPCVIGYDISIGGTVVESSYAGNQYLYKTIPTSGSYAFGVKAVNKYGQKSTINTCVIVISGPGLPTNFSIKVLDNFANLQWTAPTVSAEGLSIAEYEVYKQNLSDTYVESLGRTASTYTSDLEYIPGDYRYFVQAVDIAGNVGPLASATCEIESPNFQLLTDVKEGFGASISTNVYERSDGVLIAPVNTTETFGEHFVNNSATSMQDFINRGHVYNIEPTPVSAAYSFELDYGTVINQATNIISITDVDNKDSALSYYVASKETAAGTYDNEVNDTKLNDSGFQFARTRFGVASNGKQFCFINSRRLQLSSKKRSESHLFSATVAGAPATIIFDTPFIAITDVSASLKYTAGSTAIAVQWDDGSGTPIPSIDIYPVDTTKTPTTGNGTVRVEGY